MKIINEMQELSEDYPDDLSAKEILDRTMVLMQENQNPLCNANLSPLFLSETKCQTKKTTFVT
jgi:hypothetical protein